MVIADNIQLVLLFQMHHLQTTTTAQDISLSPSKSRAGLITVGIDPLADLHYYYHNQDQLRKFQMGRSGQLS